jgi:hypothetical protein
VRDEDLRVEAGAELALQSGPQVGQADAPCGALIALLEQPSGNTRNT